MKKGMRFLYILIISLACLLHAEGFAASEPIAVYLTWQRSPDSTMTINWITKNDQHDDQVLYHAGNEQEWQAIVGRHTPLPDKIPYILHRVELTSLQPETVYDFKISKEGKEHKFHTLPIKLTDKVSFVVGGDIFQGDLQTLEKIEQVAAKQSPDFALIGGDIAYSCYRESVFLHKLGFSKENSKQWLKFLSSWYQQMITPEGHLIPIIPAIGNHDVVGGYDQSPEQARFFYALFPMPGKNGYNALDFGDYMSIFILDSGHTHPIDEEQSKWLAENLQSRAQIPNKFALYHVGAYPSVREELRSKENRKIRKYWVPLFEKHGLNVAFEHHDHAYKRTHPLLNGQNDPKGVVYIGDGGWAVRIRTPKTPEERPYLAISKGVAHVNLVTIDQHKRHFKAIDIDGNVVDEFEQTRR